MFSCEYCEIIKNAFFKEHLLVTASVRLLTIQTTETLFFFCRFYFYIEQNMKKSVIENFIFCAAPVVFGKQKRFCTLSIKTAIVNNITRFCLIGTKYSRMGQLKFVENLEGYSPLKHVLRVSSTNFSWSILKYFVPFIIRQR